MKFLRLFPLLLVSACVTTSGNYTVSATQADGTPVNKSVMAQGSGIYPARNAFCQVYPGATVKIVDISTGEEYAAESPYQCD
jgi:hypothetical protein